MAATALQDWENVHNPETSPERGRGIEHEHPQKRFERLPKFVAEPNGEDNS